MGDARFIPHYERVANAADAAEALRRMQDEEVVMALAAASRHGDPLLANVLATEAQNRMRRSRAALEHLGEGVVSVDREERVTFVNPAAARMLGCAPRDLVGASLHARHGSVGLHPDGRCCVVRAMQSGLSVHCETETLRHETRGHFAVAYTAAPLVREGEVEGAVLVFADATERKRAERALRESEARWRSLSEASFEAILVHDRGRILDANRACADLLGVRREDLLGRDALDFVLPEYWPLARHAMAQEATEAVALECLRADGTRVRVEARGRNCVYGGKTARVVAIRPLRRWLQRRRLRVRLA